MNITDEQGIKLHRYHQFLNEAESSPDQKHDEDEFMIGGLSKAER